MARPRKCDIKVPMRDRILNSFWDLMKDNDINDITVCMITDAAECNRGSFYYHFDGLDDMMAAAINRDCVLPYNVADNIYGFLSGDEVEAAKHSFDEVRLKKIDLAVHRGAMHLFGRELSLVMTDVWAYAACGTGKTLSPGAAAAIEYCVSGMVRMLGIVGETPEKERMAIDDLADFYREVSLFTARMVAEFQGMSKARIVRGVGEYAEAHDYSLKKTGKSAQGTGKKPGRPRKNPLPEVDPRVEEVGRRGWVQFPVKLPIGASLSAFDHSPSGK